MPGKPIWLVAAGLAGALALAACGAETHPSNPRPPAPISITAQIDDGKVSISPNQFGAGLTVITISNQAEQAQTLVVEGPRLSRSSRLMDPGATAELKVDLEPGIYAVAAGADSKAKPAKLKVGPPRPSAQNELLQP